MLLPNIADKEQFHNQPVSFEVELLQLYYFRMYSNKYYCLLKKKKKMLGLSYMFSKKKLKKIYYIYGVDTKNKLRDTLL